MKHADEGTLHAYLDGELSPAEVTDLERHVSVCAPCRALLSEARGFLSESDTLVQALDIPVPAKARRAPRRMPWSTLAWAATVVLALGTGYALRPALGPQGAASVLSEKGAPVIATATEGTPPAAGLAGPTTPAARPAAPAVGDATARSADLASAAGAGVVETRQAPVRAEERTDVPPRPAPATPDEPARVPAEVPSALAYIDGTPVDTTTPRLNFGPRSSAAPRRVTLDEAVTRLGGTIRLIDGLAPQRVEVLSGVDVSGADPDREVIRVYYEEPDLGMVTLDQQRPAPSFAARDSRRFAPESEAPASAIAVNPTPQSRGSSVMRLSSGLPMNSLSWRTDGVWLSLSSRLTGDALAQLQARVK